MVAGEPGCPPVVHVIAKDGMDGLVQLLIGNPLLLLFVVSGLGYPFGRISVGGISLGVSAVLFVGLAIGALHPDLKLPEAIYQLGLVLLVYTVGLSSGRQFFASFRRKGLRDNLFVAAMLVFATAMTAGLGLVLQLRPALIAGIFSGSLTSTAALAGILEHVQGLSPGTGSEGFLVDPVVGFSITYPMGVVGMILAIALMQRIWKPDYGKEATALRSLGATDQHLQNRTLVVTHPEATEATIQELVGRYKWGVVFGRLQHDGKLGIAGGSTRLALGDRVGVIGSIEDVAEVAAFVGHPTYEHLEADRSSFDFRRVFVSNPKIAGHRLRDLHLPQQFGAFVTRIRRGDIEMLAHGDTVLELGDRVRVLARHDDLPAVSELFGDSYRSLSEIDILTFSLGLALGLLLGMVPIPLPGVMIKLGFAGGPLIVALLLGALERTGPLVWNIPYSANLTLRQLGLVLFLAGIGTRSGYAFVSMLQAGGGAAIFATGVVVTAVTAITALWLGHRLLKIPMSLLIGMVAGLQTQPAVLGFALEQTRNELPNLGYAAVYPVALITKIILAQLLLVLLL